MTKKNRYVVGLDGGGTKTAAILARLDGTAAAEVKGGASNFQIIGPEKTSGVLFGIVQECCRMAGCEFGDIECVVAGLTGAGRPSDKERMRNAFQELCRQRGASLKKIVIESDARVALEGAFKGKPGIILIAGTGSIAFGKDMQGKIHRVGGWGRMIGDEGGGYAIGRDGMNAVSRELDGRGEPTKITKLVSEQFGLSDQEKIIAAVYRESFDIASVAPLVLEAASRNDSVCGRIVDRAASDLCEHIGAISARLGNKVSPVAFVGTILSEDNPLAKALRQNIAKTLPHITIVQPLSSPAHGAVLMALEAAGGEQ